MNRKLNTEFVNQYKSVFADQLIQQSYDGKTHLTGKDILNISPIKQLNLFILKTLFTEWQEEIKRLESPYFDYRSKEVRSAMIQFMNLLSQHISIEKENIKSLIEEALTDVLILAFEPGEYVAQVLEGKTQPLANKAIAQYTKYLLFHKAEIESFLAKHEGEIQEEVANQAFADFTDLDIPDDKLIDNLSSVLIVEEGDLFQGIPKAVEEAIPELEEEIFQEETIEETVDPHDGVQESTSESFFSEAESEILTEVEEEKEEQEVLEEPSEHLEVDEPQPEPEGVDRSEDSLDTESEIEEVLDEEMVAESDEESEIEEEQLEENDAIDEASAEEVELDSDEQTDDHEESDVDESAIDQEETVSSTINDQFETEVKTLADLHEEKGIDSIMDAISINHKYMFLQELFQGDNDHFKEAIERVEQADSFDSAVQVLVQNYAREYDWDMNSDEVKELLKVIFRRFR